MHRVASYRSPVEAQLAVLHLLEHGVLARFHATDPNVAIMNATFRGQAPHEVLLFDRADEELALALLAELAAAPPAPYAWDDEPDPDLARLDPALALTCPACGHDLRPIPADEPEAPCPACAAPVDLAERAVELHGPEALGDCYPDPEPPIPEELVELAPLRCPGCDYRLTGLPPAGRCPECGSDYDKAAMIRLFVQGG